MKKLFLLIFVVASMHSTVNAEEFQLYKYFQLLKAGNYSEAAYQMEKKIEQGEWASVNQASEYIELAMLKWNLGKKYEAQRAVKNAIHIMKNGDNLANSQCEERAEIFLEKMKNNNLPKTFVANDFYLSGVLGYIMEIPYAVYDKRCKRGIRFYSAQTFYADNMMKSYRHQANSQALISRAFARKAYLDATKDTFSPNNPPPYGSKARKHWDACKKIYDIFK